MSHAAILIAVNGSFTEAQLQDAVAEQMAPFDENNECFADGSRWDWWQIGGRYSGRLLGKDFRRKSDLDVDALYAQKKAALEAEWEEAQGRDARLREIIYDITPSTSREEYTTPRGPLTAYAFLRNHRWQEAERMGWFATATATECEIKNENGKLAAGKCIFKQDWHGKTVRIINWGESAEQWQENFYHRFIEKLPDNEWLVMVDYHV